MGPSPPEGTAHPHGNRAEDWIARRISPAEGPASLPPMKTRFV
jgi:hypothetical protein